MANKNERGGLIWEGSKEDVYAIGHALRVQETYPSMAVTPLEVIKLGLSEIYQLRITDTAHMEQMATAFAAGYMSRMLEELVGAPPPSSTDKILQYDSQHPYISYEPNLED